MVGAANAERGARALEFGIYRDGDNNLDEVQAQTLAQAATLSDHDGAIEFNVEDTTARRGFEPRGVLRTESYTLADGRLRDARVSSPHDMSARANLAAFVAGTLDAAERSNAKETWLDLVDHGGGDGGGLQADHGEGIMRADDIAGAIADGVARHAANHPEDRQRAVDGVVANQCLMSTLAFSSALSSAGVRYLAASPETMLAPGVPSTVAADIAHHEDNPDGMAHALVGRVMRTEYDAGGAGTFGPAAAFDVIDLDPSKTAAVRGSVAALDGEIAKDAANRSVRAAIREDAKAIDGMVRFTKERMPWHADRPALALYDTLASDGRLPTRLRADAKDAKDAVAATVLAHGESDGFAPFDGANYSDAAGPTVHFPVTRGQIDAWAPQIRETDNAFYDAVGASKVTRALA
ncbi:MAG: hypothetical protein ABI346_01510 [Candidatus Baltobacteraceae bacterium]